MSLINKILTAIKSFFGLTRSKPNAFSMTGEQIAWNKAVDQKRMAKKARKARA